MKPQPSTSRDVQQDRRATAVRPNVREGAVSSPPPARAGTLTDLRVPSSYPRRIFLAVTGLSPQIVTETLYALAVKPTDGALLFVPTEVHIITTAQGAEHARLNLLSEQISWFHRLRKDYGLPEIAFDAERIHQIPSGNGGALEDIRTPQDNERAADFITEVVRSLTASPQTALHVSIAGGRKTMSYYLGYALSLLGRAQDRLSHVLVSAPYENNRDFYYPTPYEYAIHVMQKGKEVAYDCRKATIDLADIPFVRLREGMPQDLLDGKATFLEAVDEAQRALPPTCLVLDPSACAVMAGGERLALRPAEFAFYWMLAVRCQSGRPGAHWSEEALNEELLDRYKNIINPFTGAFERAEATVGKRYTKENFDPTKSRINKALKAALGARRAKPYLITALGRIPGTKYTRFGLNIPASVINVAISNRHRHE